MEKEKETEKPKLKKKLLLFYCEEGKDLAIKVADESDNITLQYINWGKPDVIFEQMSVIYMFALHSAASFTLVLPFFPTTTTSSEDQDEEIEVQTAYADFDRHFGDHIWPPRLLTGIGLLIPQLRLLPGYSNSKDSNMVAIAFPTYVAHDAFHKRFTEFPVIDFSKIYSNYSDKDTLEVLMLSLSVISPYLKRPSSAARHTPDCVGTEVVGVYLVAFPNRNPTSKAKYKVTTMEEENPKKKPKLEKEVLLFYCKEAKDLVV
ncbi:hypothetical protein Droror1_Dr00008464 [Drosera rotundifolia]